MKIFLSIAAVLAWLFAAMMLGAPASFLASMNILQATPLLGTLPQAHGATLAGEGVILWMARGFQGEALRAVLAGNLVVHVLSLAVAIQIFLIVGTMAMPALVCHVVLGGFFGYFLMKTGRA
jgi:hypothetical protein